MVMMFLMAYHGDDVLHFTTKVMMFLMAYCTMGMMFLMAYHGDDVLDDLPW